MVKLVGMKAPGAAALVALMINVYVAGLTCTVKKPLALAVAVKVCPPVL